MRILVLVNHYPPVVDGVADYTYFWANAMESRGFEVYIVCRDKPEIRKLAEKTNNHKILPIVKNWHSLDSWKQILISVRNLNIGWVVVQYVPQSFQKRGWPWGIMILLAILRYAKKVKLLVFFHEVRVKISLYSPKSWISGIPMYLLSGIIHWLAHLSITSNGGYARLLSKYGKKVNAIIPVGSNIDISPVLLKQPHQTPTLTLGVFGFTVRGWEVIIPTLQVLRNEIMALKLLVVGGIPNNHLISLKTQLHELQLSTYVEFTGYLSAPNVVGQLQKTDIYLMLEPSISTNTWTGTSTRSGTLATAMGLGLPIIGVRGELTDCALQEGSIWLLDQLNAIELIKAIRVLHFEVQTRQQLSQSAKAFFQTHLRWEVIAQQYSELFYE